MCITFPLVHFLSSRTGHRHTLSAAALLCLEGNKPQYRLCWHKTWLHLPPCRPIICRHEFARFSRSWLCRTVFKQAMYLCPHRYKAAMQEAQTKSRSLAVAMQSLQRKPAQWPAMPSLQSDHQSQPMQQACTLLKSAMKQQPMSGSGREAMDRLRPMTASSVMQAKLGAPASILPRPGSALSRYVVHVCYRCSTELAAVSVDC